MPILSLVVLAADVFCVVHAARTGRFLPWAYVVMFLPVFGAAAYFFFEILPELWSAPATRKAQTQIVQTINPDRRYRALRDELEFSDTISNRAELAQECIALGKYEEALRLYEGIIALPQGDESIYFLGKAKAQFGLGHPADALATLDLLQSRWPMFRSLDGHLLYAMALEATERLEEALHEYESLVTYYAGAEPRVRQMLMLDRMGRIAEAKQIAAEIVKRLERSPRFVRKQQAEWLSRAKAYLKA
jgi:hypothetical protein